VSEEITFGEPTIHQDGMTFGFEWERGGQPMCRIMAQDVRQDGDAIYGEVTVWWLLDQPLGVRAIVPKANVKLNSAHSTGWKTIATMAEKRISGVDWVGAMTVVTQECMERLETGSPNVRLGAEGDGDDEPFILKPFIANSGATVLYGEGGLSKSLIALAMSLSVSTGVPIFGREPHLVGPVMYFDYEDDSSAHDRRVRALCRSFGIPTSEVNIYHHALTAKVTTAKREMRRRVEESGAVLGILDSVGMGRGGSAIAAEDTIRMFRALREVGVPFLAIDHVSKEAKDKKGGDVDAYGSIYTMNSARLAWSLTRQHTGKPEDIHIHAINRKANHVRTAPPQTIAIRYHNDDRGVPERIDIETGNEFGMLMPAVGTHERVQMYLTGTGNEWTTYAELEEQLGIPSATIRSMVSRDGGSTFEVESAPGKPTRVRCCTNHATPLATPPSEEAEDDETQQ
jgi:hypothetical protein